MNASTIVTFAATLSCVAGCKEEVPLAQEDIPGVYLCNLPGPRQTIDVLPDGTFRQVIGDGKENSYHGRWTAGTSGIGFHVMLRPYHFKWPSYIPVAAETGDWIPVVKRTRKGVILVVSDGDGLY